MYSNTTTSIKLPTGITEEFDTNVGIRQGDGLSPLLFCLFIDDVSEIFDAVCMTCKIGSMNVSHLLYADDLVMFSETESGLQSCINRLKAYCDKWKLRINMKKAPYAVYN